MVKMARDKARLTLDMKVDADVGEMIDQLNREVVSEMQRRGIKRKRGEKSYRAKVAAACIREGYPKVLRRLRREGPSAV